MSFSPTTENSNPRNYHRQFLLSCRGQLGQATAEYVLLLFVIVGTFAVLSTKMFAPIKKWSDFYLGQYTYCLIDTGSLPKEAGGNPTECEQLASKNGYGNSKTGADKTDKKTAEQMQAEADAKAKARADAEAQAAHEARKRRNARNSSGKAYSGGRDYASNRTTFDTPRDAEGDGGNPESAKVKQIAKNTERNSGAMHTLRVEGSRSQQNRMDTMSLSSSIQEEQEKIMRREVSVLSLSSTSEADTKLKPKKLKLEPSKKRELSSAEEQSGGFAFGNMFRIAIIGAVILVIIYLIGSQMNTAMKGMD